MSLQVQSDANITDAGMGNVHQLVCLPGDVLVTLGHILPFRQQCFPFPCQNRIRVDFTRKGTTLLLTASLPALPHDRFVETIESVSYEATGTLTTCDMRMIRLEVHKADTARDRPAGGNPNTEFIKSKPSDLKQTNG